MIPMTPMVTGEIIMDNKMVAGKTKETIMDGGKIKEIMVGVQNTGVLETLSHKWDLIQLWLFSLIKVIGVMISKVMIGFRNKSKCKIIK